MVVQKQLILRQRLSESENDWRVTYECIGSHEDCAKALQFKIEHTFRMMDLPKHDIKTNGNTLTST